MCDKHKKQQGNATNTSPKPKQPNHFIICHKTSDTKHFEQEIQKMQVVNANKDCAQNHQRNYQLHRTTLPPNFTIRQCQKTQARKSKSNSNNNGK